MSPEQKKYIQDLVEDCYTNSMVHGWYDDVSEVNIPEKICLMHSELSEALEDYRNGNMEETRDSTGKPIGFPSELADVIIRIFDFCGHQKIDIASAIERKMQHNATRPYKHGGKVC